VLDVPGKAAAGPGLLVTKLAGTEATEIVVTAVVQRHAAALLQAVAFLLAFGAALFLLLALAFAFALALALLGLRITEPEQSKGSSEGHRQRPAAGVDGGKGTSQRIKSISFHGGDFLSASEHPACSPA
jgi:hypothetical protein